MNSSPQHNDPALVLKTTPPRAARDLLERERLSLARLDVGNSQAIVITAPTGFGKTSQLAQWRRETLRGGGMAFWLTVDKRDEPMRLVSGLARAAQQSAGNWGFDLKFVSTLERMSDPLEAVTEWLAETARLSNDVLLILDDVERAPAACRAELISYLVGNAPANLTIAMGSRPITAQAEGDPLVELAHLRLSANDLRFRLDETAAILAKVLGRNLNMEGVMQLHEKTEGWPLGVQLAAAALQKNDEISDLLSTATADIRRYFIDRLIDKQSPAIKDLLVRISPFELVHPDLCAVLVNRANVLEELRYLNEQTPLFTPTEEGEWMRLHTLAREVLSERFEKLADTEKRVIAGRASLWLAQHQLLEVAAEFAFAAGETGKAFDLAERSIRRMVTEGRIGRVLEWHDRLPPEQFAQHPGFWLPTAWALAMSERHTDAIPLLETFEQRPGLSNKDRFEADLIRATIAAYADHGDYLNQYLQRWPDPPQEARPQDVPLHWIARGFSALYQGHPDQARLSWQRLQSFDASIFYSPMSYGFSSYGVGLSYLWEGRCLLAQQELRPALLRSEQEMGRRNLVSCMLAALLAQADWESNSGEDPNSLLALRLDVLERQGLPDALLGAYITLARTADQEGRQDKALSLLEELRAIGVMRNLPRLHFAAQCEMVRQHARQGRADTAQFLTRQLGAIFDSQQNILPKVYIVWMRIHLELARAHAALVSDSNGEDSADPLEHIRTAEQLAESLGLGSALIEARLLRSKAQETADTGGASRTLAETISLARAFGQQRIVAAIGKQKPRIRDVHSKPPPAAVVRKEEFDVSGAILTNKERDILAFLAQNLTNKEIARALDLSEQTVKWHLKNLFQKLGGANRKHTVARARVLGLLS